MFASLWSVINLSSVFFQLLILEIQDNLNAWVIQM
jgi:hypothetical protein